MTTQINPDTEVEFLHKEFRRLAGIKTSQRLVKPCQRDAGIPISHARILNLYPSISYPMFIGWVKDGIWMGYEGSNCLL